MKARLAMLATVAALVATRAEALDEWTWKDTAGEAAAVGVLALDWAQTRELAWSNDHLVRDGRRHAFRGEGNPILGRDPSMRSVNLYFATAIVTHVAVAAVLPDRWRHVWQASTFGLELVAVGGNVQMGLSGRF